MRTKRDNPTTRNRLGSKLKWLVPLLLLFFALAAFVPMLGPHLVVSRAKGNKETLLLLPLNTGEVFYLTYTHSANRSPVKDMIEWTGREMMARTSLFQTFGAGIPIPADGVGTALTKTQEGYLLTGIDKPMDSFLLMTEEIPDHHILYRQRDIRLNGLSGAGKLVLFEVRRVSLIERMRVP